LSPLLFCTPLIPFTHELNRADSEYQIHGAERNINHLLHLDNLKLLGGSEEDLENEIKIVQATKKVVHMNYGFAKCAKVCLKEGRVQKKHT
jgi:hypothetical protein